MMFFAERVRNKSEENIWSLNPSWIPDFFLLYLFLTLSATFSVAEAIGKEDLTYSLDWMTDPLTDSEDVLHMCKRVSNLTDNLLKTSVPGG